MYRQSYALAPACSTASLWPTRLSNEGPATSASGTNLPIEACTLFGRFRPKSARTAHIEELGPSWPSPKQGSRGDGPLYSQMGSGYVLQATHQLKFFTAAAASDRASKLAPWGSGRSPLTARGRP